MKYNINYSQNMKIIKQKGGTFNLYIYYVRMHESTLKAKVLLNLIQESIELNRYYHRYYDGNEELQKEGIHGAYGPEGFDMSKFDVENLGIDQYESTLIYKQLLEMKTILAPFNIATIQSGISSWTSDITFSEPPYFQLPFIEFCGDIKTIPIMKYIINHALASDYMSFTFPTTELDINQHFTCRVRTCLIRPYIDNNGNQINGIDDSTFWSNIIQILKDIPDDLEELNLAENDKELNHDRDWYILDPDGNPEKVKDKTSLNPYIEDVPLSTLDVRYVNDTDAFMWKIKEDVDVY